MDLRAFRNTIISYYKESGRDLLWRHSITPYRVIVSEIMLQQTQVSRVIPKFKSFIRRFPSWKALANASTKEVLEEWSGLGYNRRALYLKRMAEKVVSEPQYAFLRLPLIKGATREASRGIWDERSQMLKILPGIGPNTAGSILAFAFNVPYPFIETNIRSVFIHFFFRNSKRKIHDNEIIPLLEKTLDDPVIKTRPREWYSALMDYGSYLKGEMKNPSRRSAHHIKQKPFKGSNRELRAKIIKFVIKKSRAEKDILNKFGTQNSSTQLIKKNLNDLIKEGFIKKLKGCYQIK